MGAQGVFLQYSSESFVQIPMVGSPLQHARLWLLSLAMSGHCADAMAMEPVRWSGEIGDNGHQQVERSRAAATAAIGVRQLFAARDGRARGRAALFHGGCQ